MITVAFYFFPSFIILDCFDCYNFFPFRSSVDRVFRDIGCVLARFSLREQIILMSPSFYGAVDRRQARYFLLRCLRNKFDNYGAKTKADSCSSWPDADRLSSLSAQSRFFLLFILQFSLTRTKTGCHKKYTRG